MADIFGMYGTTPDQRRAMRDEREPELAGMSTAEAKATAKRWAKLTNEYEGSTGGWIYRKRLNDAGTYDWRAVCQGWSSFFDKVRHLILADVRAGKFKVTKAKRR